MIQTCFTKLT